MARSRAPRRPLWLIANQENGRMDVFTLRPDDDREILPVFSFREEAEMFLRLGAPETGWRARETTAGELISLLYGPCAGVKKVALDPLPVVDGEVIFDLAGSGREAFLRDFVGAPPAPNRKLWARVTVKDGLVESADGRGTPLSETGKYHGRTRNGATRRKLEKTRDEAQNGADGAAIPDYMMRDFEHSDGLRDGHDGSSRTRGLGPRLRPGRGPIARAWLTGAWSPRPSHQEIEELPENGGW